jgi:hypothetical protein
MGTIRRDDSDVDVHHVLPDVQLVYQLDHATFSLNRLVASLVMGAVMTVVMLVFMWPMYRGRGTKVAVLTVGILSAGALLYVNRSQALIGDVEFMESMITGA